MARIITMGEIMLRLTTPGSSRFLQADSFQVCYGGAEANVAASLAGFGHDAAFVSRVPDNPLGDCAVAALRKMNVDTRYIARGGDRLGIYFLEAGASVRASNVVYDRAHSAFAEATEQDFDFDRIFEGADWFHFTGITPALSKSAARLTELACKAAKKRGLTVSLDMNYRKKLWTREEARQVMTGLAAYADVFFGGETDAEMILGVAAGENIYRRMAAQYGFRYAVSTLRKSRSASDNDLSFTLYDGKEFYRSKEYSLSIVDRVGGGDAFAAGFICALLDGRDARDALEFGAAASAFKHTVPGDFNIASRNEVESLVRGDASGAVRR